MMDREYIIITIAHRLSMIKNADRIYTVENGRITESGEYGSLLSQDGAYDDLYDAQASG